MLNYTSEMIAISWDLTKKSVFLFLLEGLCSGKDEQESVQEGHPLASEESCSISIVGLLLRPN